MGHLLRSSVDLTPVRGFSDPDLEGFMALFIFHDKVPRVFAIVDRSVERETTFGFPDTVDFPLFVDLDLEFLLEAFDETQKTEASALQCLLQGVLDVLQRHRFIISCHVNSLNIFMEICQSDHLNIFYHFYN